MLPVGIYKNILRWIGFIFICTGLLFGYSAIDTILDPEASIIVNGYERNDAESKLAYLVFPVIFIIVGSFLSLSKGQTLSNMHKVRESFWSIFHGK